MLHTAPEVGPTSGGPGDHDRGRIVLGNPSHKNTPAQPRNSVHERSVEAHAGSKDVLVVEDEPYLCDLIADVLEAEGHSARKASNGLDALQMISERKPHLVLLDLMMPIMDGWEFMAELRANPAWDDVPVVIITAVYDVAKTQSITNASAVITKPFDIDQLSDVVRHYAA